MKQPSILDYFDYCVEFPKDIVLNPLPMNCLYNYVSATLLNGFINYVEPIKVIVVDRYSESKLNSINNLTTQYHTKLSQFDDDIIILSKVDDNVFVLFYYDYDVSDCMIGKFETGESDEIVIQSLLNYLNDECNRNDCKYFEVGYDNGIVKYYDLPITFISGWVSF